MLSLLNLSRKGSNIRTPFVSGLLPGRDRAVGAAVAPLTGQTPRTVKAFRPQNLPVDITENDAVRLRGGHNLAAAAVTGMRDSAHAAKKLPAAATAQLEAGARLLAHVAGGRARRAFRAQPPVLIAREGRLICREVAPATTLHTIFARHLQERKSDGGNRNHGRETLRKFLGRFIFSTSPVCFYS